QLRLAISQSSFQQRRLGSLDCATLEDFLAKVPFTRKSDLVADQAAHAPYGENRTAMDAHYVRFCQTSGTTARPLSVWDTAQDWAWLLENWVEGYRLAGVTPGMVAFFAFSFGPFLGFWTAFEAGLSMGLRCIPGGGLGTAARVNALLEHRAEVLCCTPTYALHMAAFARSEGIDLARSAVRKILVAGEPGGSLPAVRQQLEAAWRGAEVLDHYGMTEVGPVAFAATGDSGALRVLEERYFAEVIEPQGAAAVPEGALGELVLTPLGRQGWPLFRYRTGDLVRARSTESGLVLEGGILGRVDDMAIVRGVNLYPSAVEDVVRTVAGVEEYRVSLTNDGGLTEVGVEVEAPGAQEVCAKLETAFERAFSLRIPVRQVAPGTLPRFEFKARRWVRL
ncbi:MAG: phenylacetate--CoA ligase family protein, partial [Verrucomicrobia bacterium]|nr:phenylacetate--CoA ligase family protein [Verrucomicrobiota bacterium]